MSRGIGSVLVGAVFVSSLSCSRSGARGADGASAQPPSTATASAIQVTSTLDGHTTLPDRIHWRAKPSVPWDQVSEVDFLIDGQLGWVEHHAPYFYGDDGGYLVTTFLRPGEHTFSVRVVTLNGQAGESSIEATTVSPPVPPTSLVQGTWTHTLTTSDQGRASSAEPPPVGRWMLTVGPVGWTFHDPGGGSQLWDVAYPSAGALELRTTIERPPYPDPLGGSICEEPDRSAPWTYRVGGGGRTLTLRPVGRDPCGDRIAIVNGTWTRTGG